MSPLGAVGWGERRSEMDLRIFVVGSNNSVRNENKAATLSQHPHPGHRPFPTMALEVSHSS